MGLERRHVAALSLSATALIGIALHEGYRDTAYEPVKGDVPTIGFGSTTGVKMGDKTTPDRALATLLKDANTASEAVRACIHVPLHQWEFDAYSSLAFNIGNSAFCTSTLVKRVNAGDYRGGCEQILRWNKFKGRVLNGLTKRREAEYKTCIGVGV